MADIWLLLESWLWFTVLEELRPIFAAASCALCVPPSGCVPCFRCAFLTLGEGSGPACSVRPFGSTLYEYGKLTVEGSGPFWMVALF